MHPPTQPRAAATGHDRRAAQWAAPPGRDGASGQIRSMMVPVARAPPQHMVMSARFLSDRSSSCRAVVMRRGTGGADRVTEGDGPTVHVDLVPVDLVDLAPGHHDRGERLVDLEDVDVGHGHPRLLQHVGGGGDGTVEVVVGVGADQGLGHDPGPGTETGLAGTLLGHPQDGGGAVGDLRAVAGRVHPVGEHRLEAGQSLGRRVTGTLVPRHQRALAGRSVGAHDRRLDRDDLPVEPALGHGHGRLALGLEPEPVHVRPGDPVLLGDPLGRVELVGHVPREVLGTATGPGR